MTPTAAASTADLHTAHQASTPAWTQRHYGGPDRLALEQVPIPRPGPGQLLVRVEAAAIDRGTWHLMRGIPRLIRLGMGLRRPRQPIPGRDLAGTVIAVGPRVGRFAPGDRILGIGRATLAGHALVEERRTVALPQGLSATEAAIIPISGVTAIQAVDAAALATGARVLITGASGGVGSFAVQIALAHGAVVSAVCATPRLDYVRSLGAHEAIDRTTQDPLTPSEPYDAIIDIAGNAPLRCLRRALAPRGTLVLVGSQGSDGQWTAGVGRSIRAVALSPLVRQRLRMLVSKEDGADIARLVEMVRDGRVRPPLDGVVPFLDAPSALERLGRGGVCGKLAVSGPDDAGGRDVGPPREAQIEGE